MAAEATVAHLHLTVHGVSFGYTRDWEMADVIAGLEPEVAPAVERGEIRPLIAATLPFTESAKVEELPRDHSTVGEVVLTFGEGNQYVTTNSNQEQTNWTGGRDSFGDFAPGLVHYTDAVLFDEVWEREGLSKRDRSLITIAAWASRSSFSTPTMRKHHP